MSAPPCPSRSRLHVGLVSAGVAGLALLLGLAWIDVLPGAWRLRGWVLGAEARDAWVLRQRTALRLEAFERENPNAPEGSVIFLGSSTIARYPLDTAFRGAQALNRGLEGDTASSLAARLERSLPAARPGGFVVQVGGNDLRREGSSPEEVRDGLAGLLDELERRAPGVPVLLLGLFPVVDEGPAGLDRLHRTNAALAELARARSLRFVPTDREPLVNLQGSLVPELSADPHHLGPRGYDVLTRWILADGGEVSRRLSE